MIFFKHYMADGWKNPWRIVMSLSLQDFKKSKTLFCFKKQNICLHKLHNLYDFLSQNIGFQNIHIAINNFLKT